MWEWFREDFEGWEKTDFDLLRTETRKELKAKLRYNGVLVGPLIGNEGVSSQLARILTEAIPAIWTEPQIQKEMSLAERECKEWCSRFLPRAQAATNEVFRLAGEISTRNFQSATPQQQTPDPLPEQPVQQPVRQSVEQPRRSLPTGGSSQPGPYSLYGEETTSRGQNHGRPTPNRNPKILPRNSHEQETNNPWRLPPATGRVSETRQHVSQAGTASSILAPPALLAKNYDSGRNILNFMKVYNDKSKYHGSADDLDTKIRVFFDLCWKSRIGEEDYALAFSAMLADEASEYYYDTVNGGGLGFDDMVRAIRQHFESDERRNSFQEEWDNTSLLLIKQKPENAGKSLIDCFDIMYCRFTRNA